MFTWWVTTTSTPGPRQSCRMARAAAVEREYARVLAGRPAAE